MFKRPMFKKKTIFALVIIGSLTAVSSVAQQPVPVTSTVTVPKGTYLRFATVKALDPATANVGDDVPLRLLRPLTVEGVVLVPAGVVFHGTVTRVTQPGKHCVQGEVKWKLERIEFADGSTAPARITYKSRRANDHYEPGTSSPLSAGEKTGYAVRDIVGAPVFTLAFAEVGTKWLVTRPFNHNACSRYTQDHALPACATVLVQTTAATGVRVATPGSK